MSKSIASAALVLATLLAATPARAGEGESTVAEIQVHQNGTIRFRLANNATLCDTAPGGRTWGEIVVGANSVTVESQRMMLQLLVSAKLAGRPVHVWATNAVSNYSCSVWAVQL